jgi:hypothetical protein
MGIGVILNPIAWQHYLLMATPALAMLLCRLRALHWPRQMTWGVMLLLFALSIPHSLFIDLAELFAVGVDASSKSIVPALPALLTLVPLLALCLSLWLLARLESRVDQEATRSSDTIDLSEPREGVLTVR